MSNKSFILRGINDVIYEERPVPEVGDDEVLVEVKKTGICGSDVHYLVAGRIGDFIVDKPMVLGHESSGIVAKVGPKVTNLKVGDKVAMEPGATCRTCEACKAGKYNLCPDVVFAATPPYDGTLGKFYKIPSDLAYKLPDNLTLEDGAMMEPLSVAVHAVSTLAQLRANQSVAIFGCGPVGLLCMAVAKALGASRIIAVDIVPSRVEFAVSYAATEGFLPPPFEQGETKLAYSKRAAGLLKEKLGVEERGPKGLDHVIDASGAEVCIQMGLLLAKTGGTFVQLGMGSSEVQIPITLLLVKELNVKGSFRYGPGDYALSIALVSSGKINLKPLVTHRYSFEHAVEAFETTKMGKSPDGKPVIKCMISGIGVSTEDL
ncbi:xylitol dehydrogenase [Fomitiporia mediterranea MF3/22]|uniref:xylitol dehydrogenase n=1 Tax=Fomitiporia mediterranea (strain MF3/22) TaxID=694068 RepID=UPI0004409C09|nr:xylitol dehydrogenase [Fomitiporia mediterranea MF3/22]EJD01200.1 xylitol dehydrogenase [Fomitiporia mediterranea MF3/22]